MLYPFFPRKIFSYSGGRVFSPSYSSACWLVLRQARKCQSAGDECAAGSAQGRGLFQPTGQLRGCNYPAISNNQSIGTENNKTKQPFPSPTDRIESRTELVCNALG